jgi:Fe-S-cluster-containing dehydrogenase component
VSAATRAASWPKAVFQAPALRGLDASSRARVIAAGRLLTSSKGHVFYREGERGAALYVVTKGAVTLRARPRGSDVEATIRVARKGESFGEEVCLPGGLRRASARADAPEVAVAEIPVSVFQHGLGRAAADPRPREAAAARQRQLIRQATADLLRTMVLTRELDDDDRDLVLDAVSHHHYARGARIYGVGERARDLYMLASGLVQLQTEDDEGRVHVRAYLSPGDFFGDRELRGDVEDAVRTTGAVALGECQLLRLPGAALRSLVDRNPGLVGRLRRISGARHQHQARIVGEADARSTRHVFHDLYRMQMASSLLTIDQDTCVRCGHCAWSCAATHEGVARLVRRGDKVLTQLQAPGGAGERAAPGQARSLLLPNSCQHCKNPVCMIDCPTGAIGRDPEGEVFIRESLCTGCGACAKACPWENIRMAPRPRASTLSKWLTGHVESGASAFPDVAVKCDLCRDYEAPACVLGCPTGSLVRLDPGRAFTEVATILSPAAELDPSAVEDDRVVGARASLWTLGVVTRAGVVALACVGVIFQWRGQWRAGAGPGLWLGVVAAVTMVLLMAHVLPKRVVRLWVRRRRRISAARRVAEDVQGRETAAAPRSRVRLFVELHMLLGLVAAASVLGHAGLHLSSSLAGLLALTFWASAALGGWGAWVYRVLPRRLSKLERRGVLPEDLKAEGEALLDRFHRELSGRDELVKRAARVLLLPYALSRVGALALPLSGRGLADERRRLQARVVRRLGAPASEELVGLAALVRTAVELRALPARRWMTAALRWFLPAHVVVSALALALLIVHVVVQTGGLP